MILEAEEIDLGSHVEEIVDKHFQAERAKGEAGNFLHILSERGISEAVRSAAEKGDQDAIKMIIEYVQQLQINFHAWKVTVN